MDMHKDIYWIGILVIVEQTIDKPVIPPGARPVDLKKKLTASAVMKAEKVIQA